jgi:hypothetical protein
MAARTSCRVDTGPGINKIIVDALVLAAFGAKR